MATNKRQLLLLLGRIAVLHT